MVNHRERILIDLQLFWDILCTERGEKRKGMECQTKYTKSVVTFTRTHMYEYPYLHTHINT